MDNYIQLHHRNERNQEFVEAADRCVTIFANEGATLHLFDECNKALLKFIDFAKNVLYLEKYTPGEELYMNKESEFAFKKVFRKLLGQDQTFESEIYWVEFYLAHDRMLVAQKEDTSLLKPYEIMHTLRTVDLLVELVAGGPAIRSIVDDLKQEVCSTYNYVPYKRKVKGDAKARGFLKSASRATNKYYQPGMYGPDEKGEEHIDTLPNIMFSAIAAEQFLKYWFVINDLKYKTTDKDGKTFTINAFTVANNIGNFNLPMIREALEENKLLNKFILLETQGVATRRNKLVHNVEYGKFFGYVHSLSVIKDIYDIWSSRNS